MQSTSRSIQFKQAILHYDVIGSGEMPLLLFHGFGQTRETFQQLAEAPGTQYTIYSFDLFFHGKSEWGYGEQPLEKIFWKEIISEFLTHEKIELFSVVGFSMGGKFALATLEMFPARVKEIILLAPDGVKTSMWYSLATYPYAFRNLFKSMILKPERFHAITAMCFKLGLIDKGIIRFAESQMNTEEKRKQVYYSWIVFRHLKFSMNKIADIINSNHIKTTVVIGKFDKIITAKNMNRLVSKLKICKTEILEAGHNGLIQKWSSNFSKLQNGTQY